MNKDERASLWFGRIKEFRTSGQTCKDWCAEHQIPAATMNYWIRKQKQEESVSVYETEPVFAKLPEYSDANEHSFRKFRAPLSGKTVHVFPEVSAMSIVN